MHRPDTAGATAGGQFTDGNPSLGVPPTLVGQDWLNAVLNELENTIREGAGTALVKANNKQLLGAIGMLAAANDRPQTALFGHTDANGLADFLGTSVNLNAPITGTSVPLLLSFACGYDAAGPINRVGRVTADTVVAFTASQTNYVYAERAAADPFGITFGVSLLRPVYGYALPGSPATDQHAFVIPLNTMYRYTGSVWVAVQRVFIGEGVASGSAVTSVVTYALRGRSILTTAALGANQTTATPHRLGTKPLKMRAVLINLTADLNFAAGNEVHTWPNFLESTNNRLLQISSDDTNVIHATDATALMLMDKTSAGSNTAFTFANWAVRYYVDRGDW